MLQPVKKRRYLEFEKPLAELDEQVAKLKSINLQGSGDVSEEIQALEEKAAGLLKQVFSSLTPYQMVQLSRHPDRPSCLDYIDLIFQNFIELSGDRTFADDKALIGGLAALDGQSVMVLGHQKGRTTQENVSRNFGMPRPEGYRKAHRLMTLAERWSLPVIAFVDTPGAYPGLDAEERGQAVAIAENLLLMADLKVPIISVILGEGGSGGALAIAVADRLLMLEFATYSVISPEGCASIIWKSGSFADKAAEALKVTSNEILNARVASRVISEPLGGAHRAPETMAFTLKEELKKELKDVCSMSVESLIQTRYDRYRSMGPFERRSA